MGRLIKVVCIAGVLSLSLVACAKKTGSTNEAPVISASSEITQQNTKTSGAGKFALGPHKGLLGVRQYYFPCASTLMPERYQAAAKAQAKYLKRHSNAKLVLQGYAASGGSHGYNVGVAQQRAESIADFLLATGVNASSVIVVSYGAEKSTVYSGKVNTKACRVDLVYT